MHPDRLKLAVKATSSCLAIILPSSARTAFPTSNEDVPLENRMPPHVTVYYAADLSDEDANRFEDVVRQVGSDTEPFKVRSGGVGHFDNDDASVAWVQVLSSGVRSFRAKLDRALKAAGLDIPQTHGGFSPHATLRYIDKKTRWRGDVPDFDFTCGSMEIWRGSSRTRVTFDSSREKAAMYPTSMPLFLGQFTKTASGMMKWNPRVAAEGFAKTPMGGEAASGLLSGVRKWISKNPVATSALGGGAIGVVGGESCHV